MYDKGIHFRHTYQECLWTQIHRSSCRKARERTNGMVLWGSDWSHRVRALRLGLLA